jgi:murein DD-endopeptidase MepM/ murein hydrolase activator NlpD
LTPCLLFIRVLRTRLAVFVACAFVLSFLNIQTANADKLQPSQGKYPMIVPMTGHFPESGSFFGDCRDGCTRRHKGYDIIAAVGTPVRAMANGVVNWVGERPAADKYGKTIEIQHPNGFMTLYAHLSGYTVRHGDHVKQFQIIGYSGDTGNAEGAPQLHFELKRASSSTFIDGTSMGFGDSSNQNKYFFGGGANLTAGQRIHAPAAGNLAGFPLDSSTQANSKPLIVGMTPTPGAHGYWLFRDDGRVYRFGKAPQVRATKRVRFPKNDPVTAMASTSTGQGYWLVTRSGALFTFGDAKYYKSVNTLHRRHKAVTGIAGHGTNGYWILTADGGVFAFGSARFHGSAFGRLTGYPLTPATGIIATPSGGGYWVTDYAGRLLAFGNAKHFKGIAKSVKHGGIVSLTQYHGRGVLFTDTNGGVYSSSGARLFRGSLPGRHITPASPVVSIVMHADGRGYWLTTNRGMIYAFPKGRRTFGHL